MKEVVRRPDNVRGVVPVLGHDIITRASKADLLAEVKRGSLAGEFGGVSPVVYSGTAGVWAVKVERLKPAPVPRPAWHRHVMIASAALALVLAACSGAMWALGRLVDSTTKAAAGVPWEKVAGVGFVALLVLLLATKPGRACCRIVITHRH